MRATRLLLGLMLLACDAGSTTPCDATPVVEDRTDEAPHVSKTKVVVDAEGWETLADEVVELDVPAEVTVAFRPEPPGFGREDLYTSHDEACMAVVRLEVPEAQLGWRRAILAWCEHRNWAASRNGKIVSRVDQTQIHDRDRPTAWMFYEGRVVDETLDPEGCPFHGVNRKIKHPPSCHRLRKNWPFDRPKLSEKASNEWRRHPHDMERFGARGPHDWNANAYKHIPGCWDPAQLERFDVGITVTVRASLKICERYGCVSKKDIRAHWGRRSTP